MKAIISAGLLMFERGGDGLKVLLAHPGGTFLSKQRRRLLDAAEGAGGNERELGSHGAA